MAPHLRHLRHVDARLALGAAAAIALAPTVAQAQYLDPGAGSIIVQVVIAVVVGVGATVRVYWHQLSTFFARRSKTRRGV